MSSQMEIAAYAESGSIKAVVIRCGCGNPASHPDAPCPTPLKLEDLGTVAYFSRNPLRQAAWDLFNLFRSIKRSIWK
jgi:hypothetical protein